MTNNYIKVTLGFGGGNMFFFFDSRLAGSAQEAHRAALVAKLEYDSHPPMRGEKADAKANSSINRAHLSIWKRCGGFRELLPEVGEYSQLVPMQDLLPS